MTLSIQEAADQLSATAEAIQALVGRTPPEMAVWKPAPDQWSLLEIINHLVDEETDDFRPRLDLILNSPGDTFTPIDPAGAVAEGRYADLDLTASVGRFMEERGRSIGWLRSLREPDLSLTCIHSHYGEMSGHRMLASWVAHDLHHLRQIVRRRYEYLADRVAPISLTYAGDW